MGKASMPALIATRPKVQTTADILLENPVRGLMSEVLPRSIREKIEYVPRQPLRRRFEVVV